jgi:hypothetical protein
MVIHLGTVYKVNTVTIVWNDVYWQRLSNHLEDVYAVLILLMKLNLLLSLYLNLWLFVFVT